MMKKGLLIMGLLLLLPGCGGQQTMETVADSYEVVQVAQPRQIQVDLPEGGEESALEGETGRLYLTDDYEISLQTLEAGDLQATIRTLCGKEQEDLTIVSTRHDGLKKNEFVWAAAGETGQQLGHSVILDDGNYHYCLTVLRPEDPEKTDQVVWSQVFSSFSLS